MRTEEISDSEEEEGQAFYAGGSERRYTPSPTTAFIQLTINPFTPKSA